MTKLARRQVLTNLAAAPFAGLTLAAVLADPNLARAAAAGLEQVSLTTAGGRQVTCHWYEADHAFANPTSARYDQADAMLAWQRTMAFFRKNL